MAYTITLANGNTLTTIADGGLNTTSTSLALIGKNYAQYGQFLNTNFIRLLENSANATQPGTPLVGQLWYNTVANALEVYNGAVFKAIGGSQALATAPAGPSQGDLWFDTSVSQLKVWSGTNWLVVGPLYSSATGMTGALPATIVDTNGVSHVIVELYVNNSVAGIVSTDAVFTPSPSIPGFSTISPGINLAIVAGSNTLRFNGQATDSLALQGSDITEFMRSKSNTATTGTLSVINNKGLTVGVNGDFNVGVVGTSVNIVNNTNNGNLNLGANIGGTPTTALAINGGTGAITVGNGNIYNGGTSAVGNIGSITMPFNTVFAKATSSLYADVAERFASDADYMPGTVVELGGSAEVTCALTELSDKVFGVISTKAAHLMNSGAGDNATHPPIAVAGRVPVRVIGQITKGDRLVCAGHGLARAARANEANAFNVIGRSLEDKPTDTEGTVVAVVSIK